jgi:hypothetical protein
MLWLTAALAVPAGTAGCRADPQFREPLPEQRAGEVVATPARGDASDVAELVARLDDEDVYGVAWVAWHKLIVRTGLTPPGNFRNADDRQRAAEMWLDWGRRCRVAGAGR